MIFGMAFEFVEVFLSPQVNSVSPPTAALDCAWLFSCPLLLMRNFFFQFFLGFITMFRFSLSSPLFRLIDYAPPPHIFPLGLAFFSVYISNHSQTLGLAFKKTPFFIRQTVRVFPTPNIFLCGLFSPLRSRAIFLYASSL